MRTVIQKITYRLADSIFGRRCFTMHNLRGLISSAYPEKYQNALREAIITATEYTIKLPIHPILPDGTTVTWQFISATNERFSARYQINVPDSQA